MSKKKKPVQKPVVLNDGKERCPNCGSENIYGLVAAFYAAINEHPQETDWSDCSEIGPERHCPDCDHEWNDDEIQ